MQRGDLTTEDAFRLASEFPAVDRTMWLSAVDRVLAKGDADPSPTAAAERFEKTLVSPTYDGIAIQPLYVDGDFPSASRATGLPGFSPFVRGSTLLGGGQEGWDVRQPIDFADGQPIPGASALGELESGASSLLLRPARQQEGSRAPDPEALDRALDGVYLDLITVALDPEFDLGAAQALIDLWVGRGIAGTDARGVLGHDPIGRYASTSDRSGLEGQSALAAEHAALCLCQFPGVRSVVVDGTRFHEAGASDVEELGVAIASGVAYLRLLAESGLELADAFDQLEFRFAASTDQFLTIAKLRAARRLWAQVATSLGVPAPRGQRQHAMTSRAMLTRYDPSVNLLRNTVACFSASVGGADAITVEPHDGLLDTPGGSGLGRRMARNTQTILAEESHLSRIIDPAGGSWYVEWLTDAVAHHAWSWFQQIEAEGGLVAALDSRLVQDRLAATSEARLSRLARRLDVITGVSDFPNVTDRVAAAPVGSSPLAGGIPRHRYPEPFEDLRQRTDEYERQHGERPVVLLIQLGTAGEYTARATYAKSFFETAGLHVVAYDDTGSTESLRDAVSEHQAVLGCLCSTDANYLERGPDVLGVLQGTALRSRYVAGHPRALASLLEPAGADRFIYTGCNVLDSLDEALSVAGVG
jgi:methylmalonyl-CoA mutase